MNRGLGLASLLKGEKRELIVHKQEGFRDIQLAQTIWAMVEIQDVINALNVTGIRETLQIESNSNCECKLLRHRRNEIANNIPLFWRIVFLSHPKIQPFLYLEDHYIFDYLTSLKVEFVEREEPSPWGTYSITFNFDPNPYFEDTSLTKTFTLLDKRTTEITATPIKWKEEMVGYVAEVKKKQKIRPIANQSFFTWFSLVEEREIFKDFEDEIADIITHDLWLNPLTYFEFIIDATTDGDTVDEKSGDDPLVVSFDMMLEIEEEIQKVKERTKCSIDSLQEYVDYVMVRLYNQRSNIIKTIPDFWEIAFLSHPVLASFIPKKDEKIFKHLTSLEVEGVVGDKLGYTISFNFEPNPYFDNTSLTKTYTLVGEETEISATPAKWKEETKRRNVPYGKLLAGSDVSFFMWFNVLPEGYRKEQLISYSDDKIAIAITQDLWPNPLRYFYTEPVVRVKSS